MDMKIANAARAYGDALSRAVSGGAGEEDVGGPKAKGAAFADFVKVAVQDPIDAVRAGEKATAAAAAGKADMTAVATAITNAEMAVETVVAVRDRVVAAYQEILRMPI